MAITHRKDVRGLLSDLQAGRKTVEQVESILQDLTDERTNGFYQVGFMDGYDQGKKDCKQTVVRYLNPLVSSVAVVR